MPYFSYWDWGCRTKGQRTKDQRTKGQINQKPKRQKVEGTKNRRDFQKNKKI